MTDRQAGNAAPQTRRPVAVNGRLPDDVATADIDDTHPIRQDMHGLDGEITSFHGMIQLSSNLRLHHVVVHEEAVPNGIVNGFDCLEIIADIGLDGFRVLTVHVEPQMFVACIAGQ